MGGRSEYSLIAEKKRRVKCIFGKLAKNTVVLLTDLCKIASRQSTGEIHLKPFLCLPWLLAPYALCMVCVAARFKWPYSLFHLIYSYFF